MDRTNNLHEHLFSRGATPPVSQSFVNQPSAQQTPPSPPNQIDSLFHNLTQSQPSNQQQINVSNPYSNSALGSPNMSGNDDAASTSSAPVTTSADRQSALLSLLGAVSATNNRGQEAAPAPAVGMPQQIPTPPTSSQRTGQSPSNNESQGKILLEQLMAGAPRSNYSDSPQSASMSTLPTQYGPHPLSANSQQQADSYSMRETSFAPQDTPREIPQHVQQPQAPPSPTRKSMFEFVSPFDALASSTASVKKKPVPAPPTSSSSGNEDSWTSASLPSLPADPKRKSAENLIEQLTRSQGPIFPQPPARAPSPTYDPYSTTEEFSQVESSAPLQQQQQRFPLPPPPLPPKPGRAPSPRLSPPKLTSQQQPRLQARSLESPVSQSSVSHVSAQPNRRDKESSPGPRATWKNEVRGRNLGKGKSQSSPSLQPQTIVFDVSQPLDEIQAPRDAVKSTAIALVKQDPVFLPGTTIGATHWIAYAMTKGRVRVISRSSGDRTLLQLPPTFAPSASVIDMAVHGNRLAGVTSDGGFVVWELPEVITDDVPGRLLLCVLSNGDADTLHSVKWHPKNPDALAVASDTKMYLLDLTDAARTFRGDVVSQAELPRIAQVLSVTSRLIAFDFDVPHYAVATISEDSTLTLWNIHDKLPFWTHKVRGDDTPSSLTFIDDGIVIGRKNGTVFQLLSVVTKNVLSTVKFVNGNREDPDMFGHVNYDPKMQTLWVSNNRRDSLIALKIGFDISGSPSGDLVRGGFFEQAVEFSGPKPTIHFVLLHIDADPTGEEAHAACVAAKIIPGELVLVAFSVHSSGVDQILIRKEWFESAVVSTVAKLPLYNQPQSSISLQPETKAPRQPSQGPAATLGPAQSLGQQAAQVAPARLRTPPSEDLEGDIGRDESRLPEAKGKNNKGKNVAFRDRDESVRGDKEKVVKPGDTAAVADSALTQSLAKEIRKSEESLHTRIGRLIGKEMDKQHQRLEEARAHEQAEDLNRQEKILKLISTELTRNTTRVVEMAVKAEVQNSVLPALENITRTEVRAALNEHVGRGLADFIQQSLPNEIEKLFLRPDIFGHFANILSQNLNPLIERHVKDSLSKTFLPTYSQQTSTMHQELLRDMRAEILSMKKESLAWQSDAVRNQESLIRDLEHTVRVLSDQVKFLTMNASSGMVSFQSNSSPPGPSGQHSQPTMNQISQAMHRQQNLPPAPQAPPTYNQSHGPFQQQPPPIHGSWFATGIAAPQASHPVAPPPPPPALSQRTPPAQAESWDETYLAVLATQDPRQLRELLSRSNPEVVMPMNSTGPLSQAVVLTLLHRLAVDVGETPPVDEGFKSSLWWLQRTASILNTNDPLISPYIARVVPNVHSMLNSTKQRLQILPGGPQLLDSARTISDVQDILSRKPL